MFSIFNYSFRIDSNYDKTRIDIIKAGERILKRMIDNSKKLVTLLVK